MRPFLRIFLAGFLFLAGKTGAQNFQSVDTVKAPADYENIYLRKLYSDSLVSSFVIYVKKEVKAHRHVTHSEHVYVLEGEGEMSVGDKKFPVKKGSMVFVPRNTVHSLRVTSKDPVKVISVQAPMFDGKDRVMVEDPK
jgi:mannose-6-phosphate isomerase-like protein (cupin superfamily)